MSDIIKDAKRLAELKVPPLRAEVTVHEDEDPRYVDDCLVQIIEKADEYSIWHEEEYGGYEHGKLHFAHVFAAAPELAQALAEETYEYGVTYIGVNHGGHHIEWVESTGDAEFDKETLHLLASRWERKGQFPKIVRRRVSQPEVINE